MSRSLAGAVLGAWTIAALTGSAVGAEPPAIVLAARLASGPGESASVFFATDRPAWTECSALSDVGIRTPAEPCSSPWTPPPAAKDVIVSATNPEAATAQDRRSLLGMSLVDHRPSRGLEPFAGADAVFAVRTYRARVARCRIDAGGSSPCGYRGRFAVSPGTHTATVSAELPNGHAISTTLRWNVPDLPARMAALRFPAIVEAQRRRAPKALLALNTTAQLTVTVRRCCSPRAPRLATTTQSSPPGIAALRVRVPHTRGRYVLTVTAQGALGSAIASRRFAVI